MKRPIAMLVLLLIVAAAAGCRVKPADPAAARGPDTAGQGSGQAAGPGTATPDGPTAGAPGSGQAPAQGTNSTGKPDRITVFREGPGNRPVISGINEVEVAAGSEVAVGSGAVMVSWYGENLPASLVVKTSGPEPQFLNPGSFFMQARFPAGDPERWDVWLDGVADSKVTLVRKPEPTVLVEYRRGAGAFQPVDGPDLVLSPGPVTLDFCFDQPMKPVSLEAVLKGSGLSGTWVAPDHARVELAAVPEKLHLDLSWFQAATGLLAQPGALVIRSNEGAPYLERVNVITGATERLMDLPAEIHTATLAPRGGFLAYQAYTPGSAEPYDFWASYSAVANLSRRTTTTLQSPWSPLGWQSATVLVVSTVHGWVFWDAAAGSVTGTPGRGDLRLQISHDGKLGASLVHPQGVPYDGLVPQDLVITDLETSQQTTVATGFMKQYYVGKDGIDLSLWLAWSPDGQRVAGLDARDAGWAQTKSDLVIYDRSTGKRTVAAPALPLSPYGMRLYWSPDSRYILAAGGEQSYLIPVAGGAPVPVPGHLYQPFWDGTGGRFLSADADWGQVFAYMVNKGTRVDLGRGLPVGWDGDWAYIIRWAKSDTRYIYRGI